MNQIADILALADAIHAQALDAVLATVVRTEGSAYRRAGAMMLICEDGRSAGMISGGCLEPHLIKRAFWWTRHGASVQVYQTGEEPIAPATDESAATQRHQDGLRDSQDDSWEEDNWEDDRDDARHFGLGCNGRVHVLFERFASAWPMLQRLRYVRDTQQPAIIATLIRHTDTRATTGQLPIATRLVLDSDDISDTAQLRRNPPDDRAAVDPSLLNAARTRLTQYQISDHAIQHVVVEHDELTTLAEHALRAATHDEGHGTANRNADDSIQCAIEYPTKPVSSEWMIQRLQPQIRLLICGAGNDVMPLVTIAKMQDWHVTVVDSRANYATRQRFTHADRVLRLGLEDSETLLALSRHAAVAIMSHSLTQDRARLATLLAAADQYRYIGQLGPRYRTERLIREISAASEKPAGLAAGIDKLHYPIGYKLGAEGPEALALGIIAQITAVMHGQQEPHDQHSHVHDTRLTATPTDACVAPNSSSSLVAQSVMHSAGTSHTGLTG